MITNHLHRGDRKRATIASWLIVVAAALFANLRVGAAANAPTAPADLNAQVGALVDQLLTDAASSKGVSSRGIRFDGIAWETGEGVQAGTSDVGLTLDRAVQSSLGERGVRASSAYTGGKGVAGAVLRGGYQVLKSGVLLSLVLVDASTNQTISRVQKVLSLSSLGDIAEDALLPPDADNARQLARIVREALAGKTSSIGLRMATERGPRAAYVDGEKLRVLVQSDRDCYLRLYHISWSERSLTLVFPNRGEPDSHLSAGVVRRVPSDESGVIFEVSKPYGVDAIIAIADERPFGDDAWVASELNRASGDAPSKGAKGVQRVGNYLAETGIDEARAKGVLAKGLLVRLPSSTPSPPPSVTPVPEAQPVPSEASLGPIPSSSDPSATPDDPAETIGEPPTNAPEPIATPPAGEVRPPSASGSNAQSSLARAVCFFTTLPKINLRR